MPSVLITGSGRRLGRAFAVRFAERGWDVALHYNKSEKGAAETQKAIRAMGRKSEAFRADIRNSGQIKMLFESLIDRFGIPDVLVNNAAVFPSQKNLNALTEEAWDDTLDINLKAQFLISRHFAATAKKNARIINIASLGAVEIWKQRIDYNVSKAALIQLNKALARELAPNIAVNAVSPGAILIPEEPAEEMSVAGIAKIPMGRFGSPDDVFEAVRFFADAPMFITGQMLAVDGGSHLVK